ncbi:hypothetical protein UMM65_09805 [Aureibaculum sp. 2210JD6-5]|uniref:hypothetical protein n=1 Tax=Aureibaculum sp. 2210JD6-5 TaxID=3103957 RepID=UPI002AAEFC53|nr:hypothetical protein [Aureibaculum sp. 2210JD6-5]MDY7395536.1 hypothetical protein [Aureibaculum sp. 2210JD6-5]
MKNIRIITMLLCFGYFGLQNSNAQSENKEEDRVYKVQMLEVPESVKETLKSYSGYKISKDVSYKLSPSKRSKADKIYRFKIERKTYPYILLVNEKGKVMGIESEEGK